mgnify:CR=1 FL=1
MRLTVSLDNVPDCRAEPLTLTRGVGDCYVAGKTLRVLQKEACAEAGLRMVAAEGDVRLPENVWVSASALKELVPTEPSGFLVTEEMLEGVDESKVIRYPWDFLDLQELLFNKLTESRIDGCLHERATVDGVLILGEGSKVLPGVYIEGVTIVGRDCKIGPNAYLRGMTAIGDGCHVGQAVEIKNSILYPKVAIGHLSYCGDSVVGQGVNFGAGTIVSNFRHDGKNHRSMVADQLVDTGRRKFGSIIGDGVHTGIHTSIYPGRKLWPQTSTLPGGVVMRDLLVSSTS